MSPSEETEAEERVEAALLRVREQPGLSATVSRVEAVALQDFVRCPRRYRLRHVLGLPAEGAGAAPREDPHGWATFASAPELVRRMLERLDFREVPAADALATRAYLERVFEAQGWDVLDEEAASSLRTLGRLFSSPSVQRLVASGRGPLLRGWRFAHRVRDGASERILEGSLELLWQTPEGEAHLFLLEDRVRPAAGAALFAHVLAAHAVAVEPLLAPGVRIRAGVLFLQEPTPEPDFLPALPGAAELVQAASELIQAQGGRHWTGRDRATCQAQGCAFQERCHGKARAC